MTKVRPFTSERKCREKIEEIVFGIERRCPNCNEPLHQARRYWWCSVCRRKITARSVTWLKGSNISYGQLFLLLGAWQKKIAPGAVKQLVGIAYPTVARWYAKFRANLPSENAPLSGVVEVDESFFGRKKYRNQRIVMGAIERKTRRIKLGEIPDREQDTLEGFLLKNVTVDSLLHTDCHPGYYDIGWNGYGHQLHNHSLGHFKDTNQIENVWSVAKRHIRKMFGQLRTGKLPEFIKEWEARANQPVLFKSQISYLEVCLVQD